jgi:hypothetical protein
MYFSGCLYMQCVFIALGPPTVVMDSPQISPLPSLFDSVQHALPGSQPVSLKTVQNGDDLLEPPPELFFLGSSATAVAASAGVPVPAARAATRASAASSAALAAAADAASSF